MTFCVECGTTLERAGQACPACGRGRGAKRSCGSCGKPVLAHDRYCGACGTRLPEPDAPLEFDSAIDAKLRRLAAEAHVRETPAAARAPAAPAVEHARREPVNEGPDWIPAWLNALSYKKLVWGALLGVVLTVLADMLRTASDGWLSASREYKYGEWVVHDQLWYSLGETGQNLAFFAKALGVLLAFVGLVLILLRAMRKTLLAK